LAVVTNYKAATDSGSGNVSTVSDGNTEAQGDLSRASNLILINVTSKIDFRYRKSGNGGTEV
jgi:hypothetical protein